MTALHEQRANDCIINYLSKQRGDTTETRAAYCEDKCKHLCRNDKEYNIIRDVIGLP